MHELGEGPTGAGAVAGGGQQAGLEATGGEGEEDAVDDEEEEESEEEEEEELVHGDGSYVFRRKAGTISVSGFEAAIGEGGILSEVRIGRGGVGVVGYI